MNLKNKILHLDIELFWTKAHVRDVGNERADVVDKNATAKENIEIRFSLTKLQLKMILNNKCKDIWNTRWGNSIKGRITWNYIRNVNYDRIYSDFFINQVETGHDTPPFPPFKLKYLIRMTYVYVRVQWVM